MSQYWLRRTWRLLLLCGFALLICTVAYLLTPWPDIRHRLSMATAYAALSFFAASLMLGPWNVLRHRHTPVSYDLRRDVGILTGVLALVHTGVGLTVHLRGRMWMYFLKGLHPVRVQANAFGAANYAGLIAAAIFALLLMLSNDWSLRTLGALRWKSLQRWTYSAFVLTVIHAILYQWVEKRHLPWVVFFTATSLIIIVAQSLGYSHMRRSADRH